MTSYQYDDEQITKDEWERQLVESRQLARQALAECATPEIESWNPVNVPELVQFLHAQTMDYYRHIRPKRQGIRGGKWEEPLVSVEVPQSQTVDCGMTDWYGEFDIGDVLTDAEWTAKPVALGTLREKWAQGTSVRISAEVVHRGTRERITEHRDLQLHLPPAACAAVLEQLDDCLEDLGWIPAVGEIDIGADDVEAHQ